MRSGPAHSVTQLPGHARNAYGRRQPVETPLSVPVAECQDRCSNVAEKQDNGEQPSSEGIRHGGYGRRFRNEGLGLGHISDPGAAILVSSPATLGSSRRSVNSLAVNSESFGES